jgi:hypothetical protein
VPHFPAISCLGAFPTPVSERVAGLVSAGVRKPAHNRTSFASSPVFFAESARVKALGLSQVQAIEPLCNLSKCRGQFEDRCPPRSLPAQLRQGVAQWSAGNLKPPLERPVELEDQKDRTGNRQRTDAKDGNHIYVSRGEERMCLCEYREPAIDRNDHEDDRFQQLISEGRKPTGFDLRVDDFVGGSVSGPDGSIQIAIPECGRLGAGPVDRCVRHRLR